jgi:hypothetical protein
MAQSEQQDEAAASAVAGERMDCAEGERSSGRSALPDPAGRQAGGCVRIRAVHTQPPDSNRRAQDLSVRPQRQCTTAGPVCPSDGDVLRLRLKRMSATSAGAVCEGSS